MEKTYNLKGNLFNKEQRTEKIFPQAAYLRMKEVGMDVRSFGEVKEVQEGVLLILDLELDNLVHFSEKEINQFTSDKAVSKGGKYGEKGTYLAAGDLTGGNL